jgi:hypothetical protein
MPLPPGLPAPVERFYRVVYGDEVPIIETVVLKGRARLAPLGFFMPGRFVFVHNAGRDYRHYIEVTFWGLPVFRVNESYVDGLSRMDLPVGKVENDPAATQGANLALWAEATWFPSLWVTDPRARWQALDDHTALLWVPFGEAEENFVVRFNPATGLLDSMEAMRYRDAGPDSKKILWIARAEPGTPLEGGPGAGRALSSAGSVTWLDQGQPWAVFTVEEVKYNVDVQTYIRQEGP